MELDIVVDLASRFYIFETKSGSGLGIKKSLERTKLFTQDDNRFILCCMDENADPRHYRPIRLFALPKLQEQLTELLEQDFVEAEKK